ncbi:MAG: exodeoxyribonuclease VII small subunit [Gammaproteobacteria bacterium]|nr:exodeoxyribonuclease VII small subunit [Gammaproteobacteria bacterium]
MPKKNTPDFESQLAELEALVEQMEQGDLPLDDSLKAFERGIGLARSCQKALAEAEQKVQILLSKNGEESLADFRNDQAEDEDA